VGVELLDGGTIGIEPKSIETGLEMSDEVGGAIGWLADMVALELASLGLDVTHKSGEID
jgi:hypothetical protein